MHKCLEIDLFAQRFPWDIAEDYELDEEESTTRSPLNFGKAAIVLPSTGGNEDQVSRFFQTLYEGLTREHQAWMPHEGPDTRFPLTFHPFNDALCWVFLTSLPKVDSFLILVTVPKMPNLSLIPLKPSCHPQLDMRDAVLKYAIALLNK